MEDGAVSVDISELLKLTDSKEFSGKLEVIIEDNIFVPWEETIEIIAPVKVKAVSKKSPIKESNINVSVKKTEVENIEKKKPMELKKKSVKDLFFGD